MLADLPPLLIAHFAAAMLALPLGLYQLVARQGTPVHALTGRIYVPAMLVCNIAALGTFVPGSARTLHMSPFHILALVSLWSLGSGMLALRRWLRDRRPDDLRTHKIQMAYSWLGLFMAGVSQFLVNDRYGIAPAFEPVRFWSSFAAINLVLYLAGSWWIFGRLLKRQDVPVPDGQVP